MRAVEVRPGSEWPALAQDAARDGASFADFHEKVLASEQVAREKRKRTVLMRLATMPAIRTLEQFDWAQAGGAPKAQIVEFGHLAFVERAENVVMLGPIHPRRPFSRRMGDGGDNQWLVDVRCVRPSGKRAPTVLPG